MRRLSNLAFIALSPLALISTPATAQRAGETVTVTGQRVQVYRDRLAACLARHCPVNEDVDATMALAEVLFLNGHYEEARRFVLRSLDRNHRAALTYPEPVADLYRVNSRLARHIGHDGQAARSTVNILRALQAGLPV